MDGRPCAPAVTKVERIARQLLEMVVGNPRLTVPWFTELRLVAHDLWDAAWSRAEAGGHSDTGVSVGIVHREYLYRTPGISVPCISHIFLFFFLIS